MNQRVLRNQVRGHIDTIFRGRKITFRSKSTKVFDIDDEEGAAEYKHWKDTFGFMEDVTGKVVIKK